MRTDGQADSKRPVVVFLGGLGRSGSTLLERVVGELPGTCSLGEVVHLWQRALSDDERCGCGLAFSACPFWTRVGDLAFGGWAALDPGDILALKRRVDRTRYVPRLLGPWLRPSVRADLDRYVTLYESVYDAAAQVSGATAVVDSSKHASLAACLRWSRRLDLLVAHVVRDSPGVAYSWSKAVVRPEAGSDDALMPQYSAVRVGLTWMIDNTSFELLKRRGVRTALVRYEDFVADPPRVLRRLAAEAGLDLPSDALDFLTDDAVVLTSDHTVAGNPMRFRSGLTPLRRDDVWRSALAPRASITVRALTVIGRWRYGYLLRTTTTEHPDGAAHRGR